MGIVLGGPWIAPTISTIPTLSFTEGESGTVDLSQYVTQQLPAGAVDGSTSYVLSGSLGSGLTLTGSVLAYDGIGGTSSGSHQLTVTDSGGSTQSPSFGVSVLSNQEYEADWQYRIGLPGVIWGHNFSTPDEVTAFTYVSGWGGEIDANADAIRRAGYLTLDQSDGFSGSGCLRYTFPASDSDYAYWWRGFSPFSGSGGGVTGAGATDVDGNTAVDWGNGSRYNGNSTPGNGGYYYQQGNIAHVSNDNANETLSRDAYIQFRLKIDPAFFDASFTGAGGGKLIYLSRTEASLTSQERILGRGTPGVAAGKYNISVGTGNGNLDYEGDDANATIPTGNDEVKNGTIPEFITQPGSEIWPTVRTLPDDEWHTVMIHLRPGHENDGLSGEFYDSVVRMWVQRPGETHFTKIWDYWQYGTDFQATSTVLGYNAFITTWANSWAGGTENWTKYDEIILSKDFIPAPGTTLAPEWVEDAIDAGWAVGDWLAISGSSPTSGYGLTATNTPYGASTTSAGSATFQNWMIAAWNGGVLAHDVGNYGTYVLGPAGAHNEGGDGSMLGFDIETRTWTEVVPPNSSGLASSGFGEYNDGAPVGNHSACWYFYDSYNQRWAMPMGWEDPGSGSDTGRSAYGHALDLKSALSSYSASQWDRLPPITDAPIVSASDLADSALWTQQAGGAWDERRKRYYCISGDDSSAYDAELAWYDAINNEWGSSTNTTVCFTHTNFAVDTRRDVLVTSVDRIIDLKNPDARFNPTAGAANQNWQSVNTGSAPARSSAARPDVGWEFSDKLDSFLMYNDNANTVYRAAYVSGGDSFTQGVASDYTLNWSVFSSGSVGQTNGVSPPSTSAGPYNRFKLIQWGHHEIAFVQQSVTGAMYALRVN